MHELSIATALLDQVRHHTPAGHVVTLVRIEAGPLQGIDPEALTMAWQSVCQDTALRTAVLQIKSLPWRHRCPDCQAQWDSAEMYATCACGCINTIPEGSSELRLLSFEVEPGG